MKKIIVILFIILIAIAGGKILIKKQNIERPNNDYIATIYHSELLGMDAGWQYIYYIYPDDNVYQYIKSESEITEAGASDEQDIEKGSIKTKNDFVKIEKSIEKNKQKDSQQFIHYMYINGSDIKNLNSIDELADCLFENN